MVRRTPSGRAATVMLTAVCLAMAGVVGAEWAFPPVPDPARESAAQPPARAAARTENRDIGIPPLGALRQVTARPLFNKTRRPAPRQKKAAAKPPISAVLTGIIFTDTERVAIVTGGRPPKQRRLVVGEEIEGWRITEIAADRIRLRRGQEIETLELQDIIPRPPRRETPRRRR